MTVRKDASEYMDRYYSGIGSRDTPLDVCRFMTRVAFFLDKKGYTLRSGGARGADSAFEKGATKKEIYRPENTTKDAIEIVSKLHPAWHRCSDYQ